MIRAPQCLEEESNRLVAEFFSQYDSEEMKREMSDEEMASWEKELHGWLDQHASKELKLFWEYMKWHGDEGQLCDGHGKPLLTDPDDSFSWIQEWGVNTDGYCVYEGTDTLILNTDGTPINNPVLAPEVEALYEEE